MLVVNNEITMKAVLFFIIFTWYITWCFIISCPSCCYMFDDNIGCVTINSPFVPLTFSLPEKDSDLGRSVGASAQSPVSNSEEKDHFHGNNTTQSNVSQATIETRQTSVKTTDAEIKQGKGALPEGFFDNKEADLRARGIKLVKPDVK